MKGLCAVNLHHAVTVSQHRLGRRVALLTPHKMDEICAAIRFSLGCEPQ
jgi:mRNA-degrading endonuclease toxin of MazEF toxin-antitoxin module